MVLPDHVCPFGVQARQLLEQAGYEIEEHVLRTREEVDAYLEREQVETTPQIFIDGRRIGGSRELKRFLETQAADA